MIATYNAPPPAVAKPAASAPPPEGESGGSGYLNEVRQR